jgi:hypothetical protein
MNIENNEIDIEIKKKKKKPASFPFQTPYTHANYFFYHRFFQRIMEFFSAFFWITDVL